VVFLWTDILIWLLLFLKRWTRDLVSPNSNWGPGAKVGGRRIFKFLKLVIIILGIILRVYIFFTFGLVPFHFRKITSFFLKQGLLLNFGFRL